MIVPESRLWRATRPHAERIARAVRPGVARVARVANAVRPRVERVGRTVTAQLTRPGTWRYTAGAATAGLALTAVAVTAAGPWDSTGQRTAERQRAAALGRTGGADHGGTGGDSVAGTPAALTAAPVLTGLGASGTRKTAENLPRLSDILGPLLKDPALGEDRAASVVDLTTGRVLHGSGDRKGLVPASTTKIATAVAALDALGPDHRLTTRTALEPGTGELILVGGGDPTLTAREDADGQASLRELAARTAEALAAEGVREVTLSYDTTLYADSGQHPIGPNENLATVTALMADEGRTDDSVRGPGPRTADPAAEAARAFGRFLEEEGVRTSAPGPSKAGAGAKTLAEVSSQPLSVLVERMLTDSDNDIAEALARHTALATGRRADFDGAGEAIHERLRKLGLPVAGVRFHDGSGLDRADRLTARLLTALLATAADERRPELRSALTGLPVAGFTGTLAGRFAEGAGVVRAKTGTLTGVNTLAGTLVDTDGRLLAFAFLANGTTDRTAAQNALDRAAGALAACGCG